jgi:hypothetical protein
MKRVCPPALRGSITPDGLLVDVTLAWWSAPEADPRTKPYEFYLAHRDARAERATIDASIRSI